MQFSRKKLIFEGIDTYADIYFNGELIGSTKNAFLKYEFLVEKYAKVGENKLRVKINSTKPWDT
jgi:beta-mannosidase